MFSFGVFAVFINLCNYMVQLLLLGRDGVYFEHKSFIIYLLISSVFAFVLPFVVNLIENSVAIEVEKNDKA